MLKALQSRLSLGPQGRVGPIGLEFGVEAVHLVQLRRQTSEGIHVLARASQPYPESRESCLSNPAQLRQVLRSALSQGPFRKRRAIAAMPPQEVRLSSVNYRSQSGKSDAEIILKILRQRNDSDLADQVVDFIQVRPKDVGDDKLAIVAMADRTQVCTYLDNVRAAGLQVQSLEINPLALNRLIAQLSDAAKRENALAVNFGHQQTYLSLISGRRLLSDQQFNFGDDTVLKELAQQLELSPERALDWIQRYGLQPSDSHSDSVAEMSRVLAEIVRRQLRPVVSEINRSKVYVASQTRGEDVARVYLLGSIARWPGIASVLSELLKLPVEVLDPRAVDSDHAPEGAPSPDAAVATGLALRGLDNE